MQSVPADDRKVVRDLVAAALSVAPTDRRAWLRQACADLSDEVRTEVESLVRAGSDAGSFLGSPTVPAPTNTSPMPARSPRRWEAAAGDQIGNYRFVRELGRGGFGTVWLATQVAPLRRDVALKLINPGMDTRQVVARFEAERQALAMMDHAGICRVLDAGATPSGRPYFVMELVDGRPITDFCRDARTPLKKRLELFVAVCRAVQHAHQKGIIHRDIKPTNVLVTRQDGRLLPKVIDFGIAKALHAPQADASVLTAPRQMIGTPQYMSPEQTDAGSGDVDTRTDVYGLGALLYELLCGEPPFEAEWLQSKSLTELQRLVREVDPPPPSRLLAATGRPADAAVAKQIAGEPDWICQKAMSKEPARRYATADALAEDVERHLAEKPVIAGPVTWRYRTVKALRRHRMAVATAAVVALVLSAGMTGTIWGFVEARNETNNAVAARAAERAQRIKAEDARRAAEAAEQTARSNADRAQENFERLRSVHAFINSALVTGGGRVSLIPAPAPPPEVLKLLSSRLQRTKLDPAVAAPIYISLAAGYRRTGEFEIAARLLQTSIELLDSMDAADPELLASAHANLGAVLIDQEKFLEADRTFSTACDHYDRLQLNGHGQLMNALCYGDAAAVRLQVGNAESARDLWIRAIDKCGRATDVSRDEVDTALRLMLPTLHRLKDRDPVIARTAEKAWSDLTTRLAQEWGVASVPLPLPLAPPSPVVRSWQDGGLTPAREEACAFLRRQLSVDQTKFTYVEDTAALFDRHTAKRSNLNILLGPRLMQSKRGTFLSSHNGELFILELSEEQAQRWIHDQAMNTYWTTPGPMASNRQQVCRLTAVELYGEGVRPADELLLGRFKLSGIDPVKDLTVGIQVTYRWHGSAVASCHYIDGRNPDADGWYEFSLQCPGAALKTPQVIPAFFEICRTPRDAQGYVKLGAPVVVLSNTIGTLLDFKPAVGGSIPQE